MSRCYPYPPPGYVLPSQGSNKSTLIDSIKLQKDKEKAKEERRKEKKKDRKRKQELQIVHGFGQGKLHIEKSQKLGKRTSSLYAKYTKSHSDDVSSDVTEEHEQPIRVAKPSYSSENSQKCEKRTSDDSLANSIEVDGTVLKIRLSSFKKKELNAIVGDDVGPSTSGRTDPIDQNDFGFGQKLVKEHPHSTSVNTGICAPGLIPYDKQPNLKLADAKVSNQDVYVSKSTSRKSYKVDFFYKKLLESLASASRVDEGYDDDEPDWLLSKKPRSTERSEMSSIVSCSLDLSIWPHAQFLPSVDAYALPYTVPF